MLKRFWICCLLVCYGAGSLYAIGCSPTDEQIEDALFGAVENFVISLGTALIDALFFNLNLTD